MILLLEPQNSNSVTINLCPQEHLLLLLLLLLGSTTARAPCHGINYLQITMAHLNLIEMLWNSRVSIGNISHLPNQESTDYE